MVQFTPGVRTTFLTVPAQARPAKSYGPFQTPTIPQAISIIHLVLTGQPWADSAGQPVVSISTLLSTDGGQTFPIEGPSASYAGGTFTNRQGQTVTETDLQVGVAGPVNCVQIAIETFGTLTIGARIDVE